MSRMPKKNQPFKNYINRELSWIDFNNRVLQKATDSRTPLLEQAKFTAIFSNNLDEFFMVRVASLKSQVEAKITKKSEDDKTAKQQLLKIREKLQPSLEKQQNHYINHLQKKLEGENIFLKSYQQLSKRERFWTDNYFKTAIFQVLTPLAVDPAHPFPFVSNLSLNIAAIIRDPETNKQQFSRVKVPQKTMDRFIKIPNDLGLNNEESIYKAIPIEQIVANNLHLLFPGMKIDDYSFFRVTRDADLELRDIEADDLMIALEQGLRKRRLGGEIVRLEVCSKMSKQILDLLMSGMKVEEDDLYYIDGILGLDELIELTKIDNQSLFYPQQRGQTHMSLKNSQSHLLEEDSRKKEEFKSIFSIIRKKDILLHHPYTLFSSSIEEFINQSANDPLVMGIKMTLYRVSRNSPIISALIRAANNGKQVMALVELKARFDEDNNIQWAKQLEKSGVHVVYGIIGLKTHTKIALVIRKEKERLRSYFHIGTGNYNSNTSTQYTDLGLLSVQAELGEDLVELFNYLTGFSKQQSFRKLLVAPVTLRDGLEQLINKEISNAKKGKKSIIKAKMNSLVDPDLINLLYEASQAGVKIKLIVRGMCCLYPGKEGLSENIQVTSIIGRYLEHSRIFWFYNDHDPKVFLGSADWMRRNLDRRVEAVTPIEEGELKKQLEDILDIYFKDNIDAWEMQSNGDFIQKIQAGERRCAQVELMNFAD